MYCKKCGSPLVQDQIICSNCDTDNSQNTNSYVNNYNNISFGEANYNNNVFEGQKYQESNYEPVKNKKKIPIWVIVLIIILLIIPIVFLVVTFLFSSFKVNSGISNSKNNSFIDSYRVINNQVKVNMVTGISASCDDDCDMTYEYESKNIDLEVEDNGSYYEIDFEATDYGIYKDIKLTRDDCISLSDAYCDSDNITGRVYKN